MKRAFIFLGLVCLLVSTIPSNTTATQEFEKLNLRAFPNPSSGPVVAFNLPKASKVSLGIYDISGKMIRSLIESQYLEAGEHTYLWNGRNERGEQVSNGIYFARLQVGTQYKGLKLTYIKAAMGGKGTITSLSIVGVNTPFTPERKARANARRRKVLQTNLRRYRS